MSGPLTGVRVVEFAAIGPAPFGVMLLSDMGADVVRIERTDSPWPDVPIVSRGRASLVLDLKSDNGRAQALEAIDHADVVVEGFRPGVMERLGLGPDQLLARNPRLVFARMTGWGQDGPLAQVAGHDINYIGLTGMLAMLSRDGAPPVPPLNLLGDYGAGGLYLALGIVSALFERAGSGRGQVIDASIVDGSASLLAPILGMIAANLMPADPSQSMLSGSAPYYRAYRCSDGKHIAVGSLEPHFRRILTDTLDLEPGSLDGDAELSSARLTTIFASRTRDEWAALFADTDACISPILSVEDATSHPHILARGSYTLVEELLHPAVAPRLSRTPGRIQESRDGFERLRQWSESGSADQQP